MRFVRIPAGTCQSFRRVADARHNAVCSRRWAAIASGR